MGGHCRRALSSCCVNSDVYLKNVFKRTLWSVGRNIVTRWQYGLQQDGVSCHITTPCIDFLKEKFGDRMNLRNTDHHWPPYSPNLSTLDFSIWKYVTVNRKTRQSSTIESFKAIVEDAISGMSENLVRNVVRHVRERAVLCVQEKEGNCEQLM